LWLEASTQLKTQIWNVKLKWKTSTKFSHLKKKGWIEKWNIWSPFFAATFHAFSRISEKFSEKIEQELWKKNQENMNYMRGKSSGKFYF
jgi:hypothetical protein